MAAIDSILVDALNVDKAALRTYLGSREVEEGTFVPSLLFGAGATGIGYSIRYGRYRKFGSTVDGNGYILLTSKGSDVGNAAIAGLPYATRNDSGFYQPSNVILTNLASLTGSPVGLSVANTTTILLYAQTATLAALTQANFNNTTEVIFSFSYKV